MNVYRTQDLRSQEGNLEELVGSKAAGLAELPENWTPPFFALSTEAFGRWDRGDTQPSWLIKDPKFRNALSNLSQGTTRTVQERLGEHTRPRLIVRSSVPGENLTQRGRFKSTICDADEGALIQAVHEVWEIIESLTDKPAGLVIQRFLKPVAQGHLSNEQRISKARTEWIVEIESGSWQGDPVQRISSHRTEKANHDPLVAENQKALLRVFRRVGAAERPDETRVHFEWIWDGSQAWIVQKDNIPEVDGKKPGSGLPWTKSPNTPDVEFLIPWDQSQNDWKKVNALRTFQECGLETGEVFVLENNNLAPLLDKEKRSGLFEDLEELTDWPIVIRTERRTLEDISSLNEPVSECIQDPEKAWDWMEKTAESFSNQGLDRSDFCFLISRLIVCKASAWALAKPETGRVWIDSTWGAPDSLQYYPHDSFDIDLEVPQTSKEKVRGKTHYIEFAPSGEWVERETAKEWIWKKSLSKGEATKIAEMAQKVADHRDHSVAVMFFVTSYPDEDESRILPWFSTTHTPLDFESEVDIVPMAGRGWIIESINDLRELEQALEQGIEPGHIVLDPGPELVRSNEFINRITNVCKLHDIPVQLDGSILSHAYYKMRREGVRVRAKDPLRPGQRKISHEKLVRDNIPVRIRSEGSDVDTEIALSPQRLRYLLKRKAVEETLELLDEEDPVGLFEEMADVFEVLRSLCEIQDRTVSDLAEVAQEKKTEKGGFSEGVILDETTEYPLLEPRRLEEPIGVETEDPNLVLREPASPVDRPVEPDFRELSRIEVPLIPSEQKRVTTFSIEETDLELHLAYSAKQLVISLRKQRLSGQGQQTILGSFTREE